MFRQNLRDEIPGTFIHWYTKYVPGNTALNTEYNYFMQNNFVEARNTSYRSPLTQFKMQRCRELSFSNIW